MPLIGKGKFTSAYLMLYHINQSILISAHDEIIKEGRKNISKAQRYKSNNANRASDVSLDDKDKIVNH